MSKTINPLTENYEVPKPLAMFTDDVTTHEQAVELFNYFQDDYGRGPELIHSLSLPCLIDGMRKICNKVKPGAQINLSYSEKCHFQIVSSKIKTIELGTEEQPDPVDIHVMMCRKLTKNYNIYLYTQVLYLVANRVLGSGTQLISIPLQALVPSYKQVTAINRSFVQMYREENKHEVNLWAGRLLEGLLSFEDLIIGASKHTLTPQEEVELVNLLCFKGLRTKAELEIIEEGPYKTEKVVPKGKRLNRTLANYLTFKDSPLVYNYPSVNKTALGVALVLQSIVQYKYSPTTPGNLLHQPCGLVHAFLGRSTKNDASIVGRTLFNYMTFRRKKLSKNRSEYRKKPRTIRRVSTIEDLDELQSN